MARIQRIKLTAHDDLGPALPTSQPITAGVAPPGFPSSGGPVDPRSVARRYLDQIQSNAVPGSAMAEAESFSPPLASSVAPDVESAVSAQVTELQATGTMLVGFEQQKRGVPVFGVRSVVELDRGYEFVSASVNAVDLAPQTGEPALSSGEASAALREVLDLDADPPRPSLEFLPPIDDGDPVLVWHFHSVAAAPPRGPNEGPPDTEAGSGCCEASHPIGGPDFDYFLSATDGSLIYHFANHHRIDVPTWCRGEDEDGDDVVFYGRALDGGGFSMENQFEDIRTYDLGAAEVELAPLPNDPIQGPTNDWQNTHRAGVSAQVNAARVMDFLFSVLRRDSIDDGGMPLQNIVNCISRDVPAADRPEWINAVWWRGRMWYGQQRQADGTFRSLSRFLDIIAHELIHGVTETTANLVYRDLPGALNESMSDIFGIIVANWYEADDRDDIDTWRWEMGAGLGSGGGPLRHFRDPGTVGTWFQPDGAGGWLQVNGYPDHMNQHVPLPSFYDHGGVHIFSNIHNRAAYNVLASRSGTGPDRVFTPQEVSVLYYLTLSRLSRLSDFSDTRAELLNVASILYGGSAARHLEVQAAITQAYDDVGIV